MAGFLDDPGIEAGRVAAVRAYLATAGGLAQDAVELRVAASVAHLGLAARTLSPLYALAILGRRLPAPVGLRDLRWQPAPGSMFALSLPDLAAAVPLRDRDTDAAAESDLERVAVDLCEVTRPFGVSPRILRGNVASALNGARLALCAAQPGLAAPALAELDRLLTRPLLAETWQATPGGRFRRRSCCLIYRAAPDRRGPICGDCVLAGGTRAA